MTSGEAIVSAAIRFNGLVYTQPRPARHHHVIKAICESAGVDNVLGETQGFMTDTGKFVDRAEAASIALSAGQITEIKPELFSEDVW